MNLSGVRLFLVRHAHSDPGDPDELRPLSARGREQARELGERLAPVEPELVLASPLLRARETAAAIAKATGAELRVDERLAPGADAEDVLAAIEGAGGPRRRGRPPAGLLRDRRRARRRRARLRHRRRVVEIDLAVTRDLRQRPAQVLRRRRGGPRDRLRGRGRRGVRAARPERRRQDDDGRDPRGLPQRDAGEVSVLGFDPGKAERAFRERIGVVLQESELWPVLTVREIHRMFAGYYERPRDVDEVVDLVGLGEKRDAKVKTLSGGQKRRLDLGIALVGDPELVFLDEPTTGFDPAARRNAWELVRSLRGLGKTVLLTTHYLDEAQQLADRVAVIVAGEIVRIGKPSELIAGTRAQIRYRAGGEEIVRRDRRADAHAARADGAGARGRRRAGGARGAPGDARGRLPRSGRARSGP